MVLNGTIRTKLAFLPLTTRRNLCANMYVASTSGLHLYLLQNDLGNLHC